jgi:hypothetical protein
MARPVKWSRDLHSIRERAAKSRTETWSRSDLEHLFGVRRATAQSLARAIGEVQTVAGAHFVDRFSLMAFLDAMIAAPSVDEALRMRLLEATAPPRRRSLKMTLSPDQRCVMARELPPHIRISVGEVTIQVSRMEDLLESLALFARALENDFATVQTLLEPPREPLDDGMLQDFIHRLRTP